MFDSVFRFYVFVLVSGFGVWGFFWGGGGGGGGGRGRLVDTGPGSSLMFALGDIENNR